MGSKADGGGKVGGPAGSGGWSSEQRALTEVRASGGPQRVMHRGERGRLMPGCRLETPLLSC